MNKIYYYFSIFDLVYSVLSGKTRNTEIFYYTISKIAYFLISLFGFRDRIKPFKFRLYDLKDEYNCSIFPKILGDDITSLCDGVLNKTLFNEPFVASFGKLFNPKNTALYLKKIAADELYETAIFLNAAGISSKSQNSKTEVILNDNLYFDVLKIYFENEYRTLTIKSVIHIYSFFRTITLTIKSTSLLFYIMIKSLKSIFKRNNSSDSSPKISVLSGSGVTFNLTERCNFPFLLTSEVNLNDVILFFRRKDAPVTSKQMDLLKNKGIGFFTMYSNKDNSGVSTEFIPASGIIKQIFPKMLKIAAMMLKDTLNLRIKSIFLWPKALNYLFVYSRAYDYYKTNSIKVEVDYELHISNLIPAQDALVSLGGINVIYQLSCWPVSNVFISSCADVFFLFGPYYKNFIDIKQNSQSNVVYSGYLFDYAFDPLKESAVNLRKRLTDNGAEFVLCYFDENSSDSRTSMIPNKRSAYIYKTLLNKVISDKTLGLICSPKRVDTLLKRMPELNGLMETAKETGRCIFMEGKYITNHYPSASAQASDIVICLLLGGTVGLESYLCGKKTIFLDLESLYSFPEYVNGKNKVVFDNLDTLIDTIDKYRNNPEKYSDIGESKLVMDIRERDPYRDKMAINRIAHYLNRLITQYKAGKNRNEAISYANEQFLNKWSRISLTANSI